MNCTPAEVAAAFIVWASLGTRPATAGVWPVTVGSMPDDIPDARLTVYDLMAETQGKIHDTGESVERPTVQIRSRSKIYRDGFIRLKAITDAFSEAVGVALTVNSVTVKIVAATVTEPAKHIGQEEKNLRQLYTAVVKLTIIKV